ncbi:hypothetical protein IPV08_13825 [Methylobacterium sp. SD274]|uniref:hypothetical protein n=1 Tax=Methylobacterium sp. SD274 TaxID=2782009 RepID=UPI001A957A09|nr:hypothetical protein [Methylobacterium sp. SD274]MBO1021050.1 hypothetical protein [Methylobacterium sp. SD274]
MTEPSPTPSTGNTFIPGAKPLENKPLENNPPPSTGIVPETQAIANHKATPPAVVGKAEPVSSSPGSDQLARIEDKCARIEDKYARSEALLSRVEEKIEGATTRMSEAARQSDLAALRSEVRAVADRTRRLPGSGALVLTAVITAVLTVALTIAAQRFHLDGLLPPR